MLYQKLHIHHGQQHVGTQTNQHGHALHAHEADHHSRSHVAGGAGDEHHAKQGAPAAKPQQHQIGLLEKIGQCGAKTVEHGSSYQKNRDFTEYIVYHRRCGV
ncbi:hypothetical protein SDC9_200347 [bioreactor metagenome]|uniref:Uncharacterized protein n=1 Tax=bioreactor metagenome TaxID=1076179 RepID=A0A645IMY1_9ZZZZ